MVKKTYLHLDSPVQYMKGVGPRRSLYFSRIGVQTVHDLMHLVPRRYIDYSTVRKIRDIRINDEATVVGRIQLVEARRTRTHMHLVTVLLITYVPWFTTALLDVIKF